MTGTQTGKPLSCRARPPRPAPCTSAAVTTTTLGWVRRFCTLPHVRATLAPCPRAVAQAIHDGGAWRMALPRRTRAWLCFSVTGGAARRGVTRVLDTTSEPGAGKGTARRPGRCPRLTSHARDACRDACARRFPSLLPPGQGKEHSTFQQCFYCRTARVHVRGVPMPVLLCRSCSRSYATPHSNLCTAFN